MTLSKPFGNFCTPKRNFKYPIFNLLPTFLFFIGTLSISAQSPGGVSSSFQLWLKADVGVTNSSGVSNWVDQSPNALIGTQSNVNNRPAVIANDINFYPSIDFQGDPTGAVNPDFDYMDFGITSLNLANKMSVYYVGNIDQPGQDHYVIGQKDGFVRWRFANGYMQSVKGGVYYGDILDNFTQAVDKNYVHGYILDDTNGYHTKDGAALPSETFPVGNLLADQETWIGGTETNGLFSFDGQISEIIVYNETLNGTEQKLIESYLALKYGITLDQTVPTDYLASGATIIWDASENTGYDSNIFGIGREDTSGLDQKISKSVNDGAILTIALDNDFTAPNNDVGRTTSHANDNQFLLIANDGGVLTTQTAEIDNSQFNTRVVREWKVDKTINFSQDIHLKFNGFDETWSLISTADGDFSANIVSLGTLDANGELTGISPADGMYLTLAKNAIVTPSITSSDTLLAGNGEVVTITGTGFTGTTGVSFGASSALNFTVVSDTEITATVGTGASGSISVTNPAGTAIETGFIYKIAQYDFENNPLDATENNYDGIEINTVTYETGAQGQAICFDDGPGFVQLPNNLIRNLSEFTISLRFKTTRDGTILGYQNAEALNNTLTTYIPIIMIDNDGKLKGTLWTGPGNGSIQAISENVVNDGNWHQVDLVGAANSVAIYLDGSLEQSRSGAPVDHIDMSHNQLGLAFTNGYNTTTPTGWEYFNGCIDDMVIIDKALTAQELRDITALPEPTITSFTPTETGQGTTVTITGTNFEGATQVTFGGINAASYTLDSNTQITAVLGSGASGDVTVTTAGGTATSNGFTYVVQNTAPTVTSTSITSATAQSLYLYDIKASDADNDVITWTANTVPSWLAFTSGTLQTSFVGTGATPRNTGDGVNQSPDGTSASTTVIQTGAAAHGANKLFFTDTEEYGIRYVDANGDVQTWYQGDGTFTNLNPVGIAYEAVNDAVYVGDYAKTDIVKIDNTGTRTLLSNLPEPFMFRLLVNANSTRLYASARGGIYEIDLTNNDPNTNWTRVVGTGTMGYSNTGTASTSQVNQPHGMAFDSAGRLVFTDRSNDIIRRVNLVTDTIETIAGAQGAGTEAGNGGSAINATFADPSGLVINEHDEIFISERLSKRIRKIDTNGDIDTFFTVAAGGFADDLVISEAGELFLLTSTLIAQVATKAELTGTPTNADAGVHNVALTLSDGMDNVPYNFQITVEAVNYVPTDISLDTDSINQSATGASATVGTLSTTDADSGDSHTYSLVAGTGDIHNASFNINGATLRTNSALAAGNYNIRINTNDGTDDFAKEFTVNVLDDVAPEGYTVSIDQDPIDSSNQTSINFTFAGAAIGTTYNYSFDSDNGGTRVTGTGTITSATDQITAIDLSGLADGLITLTVTLTDSSGNEGNPVKDSATKNLDQDNDGISDDIDNCPSNANADQLDTDNDGEGDVCDTDDDNDGTPDTDDDFPLDENEDTDTDGDGTGDNEDDDDDNDGTPDTEDEFPLDENEDTDTDGDGTGDNEDDDDDNDGTSDTEDEFPLDENEDTDTDGDGTGDNEDDDDDNDGTPDTEDDFPLDENEDTDTDDDGIGDNEDTDDDGDGIPDTEDSDSDALDTDGDGIPDTEDEDDDNDGTPDSEDDFPLDENEDTDTDGDGEGDNADTDDDNDGIPDTEDSDSEKLDTDGDGIPDILDTDDDNDGVMDTEDSFPLEAEPTLVPAEAFTPNGDGINDTWVVPGIDNHPNNMVRVYNRWGHEVFAAQNYRNDWTGRHNANSNILPTGSYLYVIDLGNGTAPLQGWIFINY